MKRIVIVGAGISGLAAAEAASAADTSLRITVLEKAADVGGKAQTLRSNQDDGWLVEAGPTGFLDNEPVLDRLVDLAGLDKLPANAAAARRFVLRGGKLREVQTHPLKFATSGILGPFGLLRVACEPFIADTCRGMDESVFDFAARRLGKQVAERMIAPMVLGVFAGDAKKLSLPAAFPRMRELENQYGSLIKALIALKKQRAGHSSRPTGGPGGPAGTLTSFRDGLQTLPRALAAGGRYDVRCNAAVRAIQRQGDRWSVAIEGEPEGVPADAVILAGEAWSTKTLLPDSAAPIAHELDDILHPHVAVVALGFGAAARSRVPHGFGALIPRGEGYRILGVLWDSFLFDGRSANHRLLVRSMLGGSMDPEVAQLSDAQLVDLAHADLARLHHLSEAPVFTKVIRWPAAIAQYELGHLDRVARIESELAKHPGLFLAGNALHGIAFGKAAVNGWAQGEKAAAFLGQPSA